MDEELKLGFHRLGRTLEDPVNMGLALVCLWTLVVLSVTIGVGLSLGMALLLIFAGVALAIALRRPIELWAAGWRRRRLELQERHPRFPTHA